jgi:serine protease Do
MRKHVAVAMLAGCGVLVGLLISGASGPPAREANAAPAPSARQAGKPTEAVQGLAEMREFAGKLETLFQTVAAQVSPAVVLIESERTVRVQVPGYSLRGPFGDMFNDPFFRQMQPDMGQPGGEREMKQRALGSGCILDEEGYILTNNHVVAEADKLKVTLTDGRSFDATLAGRDEKTDLAVIKLTAKAADLPTVALGDSDRVKVGQWVLAIGNPFGLRHTVSTGIISATGRSIGAVEYESMIQTDAAINRGNSGGPLVNLYGEVIGINSAIVGPSYSGIGFAIPINMAKDILADLKAGNAVVRGYLGVYISDLTPEMAAAFGFKGNQGALVNEVNEGSPATEAGLKSGDIVVAYDGHDVANSSDLRRRVAATKPDTKVQVKVWREGKETTLSVRVANLQAAVQTAQDWLGLHVQTLTPEMSANMGKPDLKGVLVAEVDKDSPAAEYISPGDVILSVNRVPVTSVEEYSKLMGQTDKERGVLLRVLEAQSGRARFLFVRRP